MAVHKLETIQNYAECSFTQLHTHTHTLKKITKLINFNGKKGC